MAARIDKLGQCCPYVSEVVRFDADRLTTFRRKKPFSDDRATSLGARTRRQVAADKL
jgi:hypothetical protein